jgi:uncharacterized protein YjiS (DUF1127 family)
MQPGLDGIGILQIVRGKPLRLQDAAGRHLSVIDGTVWVTQQADPRDPVIAAGETFRFDRDGLALVTPLGGPAQVVLEGEQPDASRGVLARMRQPLVAAAGSLGRALRRRRTVRELQSLSDHMLRDVGLRRDQIDCVAKELAC